jgi:hypothetical protein
MKALTLTKKELDKLAHVIAHETCCSVIESHCISITEAETCGWWSLESGSGVVDDAVAYLKARGLIWRHAENPDWVRIERPAEPSDPVILL